jgi:hypothetical protein
VRQEGRTLPGSLIAGELFAGRGQRRNGPDGVGVHGVKSWPHRSCVSVVCSETSCAGVVSRSRAGQRSLCPSLAGLNLAEK